MKLKLLSSLVARLQVNLSARSWRVSDNVERSCSKEKKACTTVAKETCWEMHHWERNCCRNSLISRNKFFSPATLFGYQLQFFHAHKSGNLSWPIFFLCYDTIWRKSRASLLYKLKSSILAFLYEILRCNHMQWNVSVHTIGAQLMLLTEHIYWQIWRNESKMQPQLLCAISMCLDRSLSGEITFANRSNDVRRLHPIGWTACSDP